MKALYLLMFVNASLSDKFYIEQTVYQNTYPTEEICQSQKKEWGLEYNGNVTLVFDCVNLFELVKKR